MRPSLSGVVPRHHPDDPQTGAAPQRSINLKTRPCTVCLHRVLRKDLERLINGIPRNPRGRGEADPKAFAAGGDSDLRDSTGMEVGSTLYSSATLPVIVPVCASRDAVPKHGLTF